MDYSKIENYLYEKEMQDIREACSDIWKEFGGAFKESIIDKALTIALQERGLRIDDQKRIDIYFHSKKVGVYIPDKVVNDIILIELKCKPILTKVDEKQFWYYLKATSYKVGLLINFGPNKLEIRRRIYDKARIKHGI